MSPHSRNPAHRAFSLIEVTLAIGVVATGLVAVLAIIPQGLNMVNDAADTATEARIAQYIVGEINVTDWNDVEAIDGQKSFFDAEGIELYVPEASGIPEDVEQVVYIAKVEIAAPLGSLPGAEEAGTDRNLHRVQVHVTDVPIVDFEFIAVNRKRYRTYSTVVARTNR